jgi:DNA-binding MarR family transcriptional regulator
MTKLLDSLEASGLIERHHDHADRRALLVTLTSAARLLLDSMLPPRFQRIKQTMDVFTESEQEQLISLLLKLEKHLQTLREADNQETT